MESLLAELGELNREIVILTCSGVVRSAKRKSLNEAEGSIPGQRKATEQYVFRASV